MIPLFVYGTLMSGQRGNYLLKNCKFLGPVKTTKNYKLYSKISYPCMVIDYHEPNSIWGELYLVDIYTLKVLNEYEGVDVGLYALSVIELEDNILKNQKIDVASHYCMSYIYLGDFTHLQVIDQWRGESKSEYRENRL